MKSEVLLTNHGHLTGCEAEKLLLCLFIFIYLFLRYSHLFLFSTLIIWLYGAESVFIAGLSTAQQEPEPL
jgi:hypothetical protein